MNVHHQVPSCCVLHHKAHVLFGLEAGEEIDQEWVTNAVHGLKDLLLTH